MTMAPDLSFRGAKRRGNLVQAVTNPPGPSYDAAVYREIAPQGHFPALRAQGATAPAEPRNDKLGSAFFPCHCEEGASPTWQSQAGSDESAGGFPVFRPSAAEIATAPLGPRNDKSGSIAPLNSCHQYCQPAWRSLSAATDAIGAYHFIGSHYESAASRRERRAAPLQHYIALQKDRTCSPALLYYYFIFIHPGYRRCTCARRSPSTRHRYRNTGRSYCP